MANPFDDEFRPSYRLTWRDRLPGALSDLTSPRVWGLGLALLVAVMLAEQINAPNSRIIKALAGLLLFVVAYRSRPFYALCFIALMFPFPFSIFVGSSTMIFVVLTALIYLARLVLRQVEPLKRTPVDLGIGLLSACYLLSFYNVENSANLARGIINLIAIVASFILFYLTANFIRTEAQLRKFVKILSITIALSIFVAMYELFLPGRVLVPHWILYHGASNEAAEGYRVGGPFYDFELFGEFMAMSFFLAFFIFRRATTPKERFFGGALTFFCVFGLLTTVTRGATLAFMGGVLYLLWAIRRHLRFRDLVQVALVALLLYGVLEAVVVNFTRSGSVVERLFGTKFVGVLPDTRAGWPVIWARVMEHPIVGHGPYYDLGLEHSLTGRGLYKHIWPHNVYLFYGHTVGLLGMAAFLFIGLRLAMVSMRDKAPSLTHPSYARSLMVVLHVMLAVFLVDQTKIEYLRNDIYLYFPWMFFGLIAATHRIIQNEEQGRTTRGSP